MNRFLFPSILISSLILLACGTTNNNSVDSITGCGHNYIHVDEKQATCTEDGNIEYYYCDKCETFYNSSKQATSETDIVVAALGHDPHTISEAATLHDNGYTDRVSCSRCGAIFEDGLPINRIKNKNEVFSHTDINERTISFSVNIHKPEVNHYTVMNVKHNEIEESFEFSNDAFVYQDVQVNKQYEFSFTTYYEDGDYEDTINVTRFISDSDCSLPRIIVNTDNYEWPSSIPSYSQPGQLGNSQKENDYVYCNISLLGSDDSVLYSSDNLKDRIKLRGNTSALYTEKKPYKIKLQEKSDLLVGLLGSRDDKDYTDKEWLLLNDNSYKVPTGTILNSLISGENMINGTYVDVYMNGDYRGVYYLCESIKRGNGKNSNQSRVRVDKTGYIVEIDPYWWNEDIYFATNLIQPQKLGYTFKYPDSDEITTEQIDYIKNYIEQFEDTLNLDNNDYQNYIDESSFAKWILTHDILGSWDAYGSNIYITKKDSSDSKLKMGPCWDFDSAYTMDIDSFSRAHILESLYFVKLFGKYHFNEVYQQVFNSIKADICNSLVERLNGLDKNSIDNDNQINALRWGNNSPETYEEYVTRMNNYITQKISWIDGYIND